MIRTVLLRTGAVVLSLVIGLGIAETAVRLLPVGDEPFEDPRVPTTLHGSHRHVDLRDRRRPGAKPDGVFRILSVGDSFAWGSGVHSPDAYPDLLERLLDDESATPRVEVVNWSRPGWTTADQLASVRPRLRELDPDLILIGFVLNDAEPRSAAYRRRLHKDLHRRSPSHPVSVALYRHSALYSLLWDRFENTRQRRAFTAYYHKLYRQRGRAKIRRALRGFRELAAQARIPIVLVIFPVFDSQLDSRYAYRDLHDLVRTMAEGMQIPALDLLTAYAGIDGRELALVPFTDPHPSRLAHRIAAEKIAEYLEQRGLIP
jgi:lysophospholipase L1-like esterase